MATKPKAPKPATDDDETPHDPLEGKSMLDHPTFADLIALGVIDGPKTSEPTTP